LAGSQFELKTKDCFTRGLVRNDDKAILLINKGKAFFGNSQ